MALSQSTRIALIIVFASALVGGMIGVFIAINGSAEMGMYPEMKYDEATKDQAICHFRFIYDSIDTDCSA